MPLQRNSWVEHWLDRYCPPGTHRFVAKNNAERECTVCHKAELLDGRTCLICGIPGEKQSVLVYEPNGRTVSISGFLCGPCLDEFQERQVIRGWKVAKLLAS
ncbi:MAG: hypothetical protein Kow0010_10300 [Dehalococcoidia bacterium]